MAEWTPEEILDGICFNNIWNNTFIERVNEDGWLVSYETPEFLLVDPTGVIHNLRVEFVPGSMTEAEIALHIEENEWEQEDD